MGVFVGIDPSFNSTGISFLEGDALIETHCLSLPSVIRPQKTSYIEVALSAAKWVAESVFSIISGSKLDIDCITIEYPVMRTFSGAYLVLIQQAFYELYLPESYPVYLVASTAIDSVVFPAGSGKRVKVLDDGTKVKLTTAERKQQIVSWVLDRFSHSDGLMINHDEASAAVLAYIGEQIMYGNYKNKWREVRNNG